MTPFQILVEFLTFKGLPFVVLEKQKAITLTLRPKDASYFCTFQMSPKEATLVFRVKYPIIVHDQRQLPAVTEFLTRVNYGLDLGNFEIDKTDNGVVFRMGHLIANSELDALSIDVLVRSALLLADRYFPAFTQVLYGGTEAINAALFADIEGVIVDSTKDKAIPLSPTPPKLSLPRGGKRRKRNP